MTNQLECSCGVPVKIGVKHGISFFLHTPGNVECPSENSYEVTVAQVLIALSKKDTTLARHAYAASLPIRCEMYRLLSIADERDRKLLLHKVAGYLVGPEKQRLLAELNEVFGPVILDNLAYLIKEGEFLVVGERVDDMIKIQLPHYSMDSLRSAMTSGAFLDLEDEVARHDRRYGRT